MLIKYWAGMLGDAITGGISKTAIWLMVGHKEIAFYAGHESVG